MAFGGALTWTQLPEKETLVFKFDRILPKAEPRQRGLTQILIPIPWSFWQKERKPRMPDFTLSSIMKAVTITQDGIVIETQTGDFIFSSSANSKRKELTLEIFPPVKNDTPDLQDGPQAPATDAENGTSATASPDPANATQGEAPAPAEPTQSGAAGSPENATSGQPAATEPGPDAVLPDQSPLMPPMTPSLSGTSALRSKIARPGQDGSEQGAQTGSGATAISDFQVRRPIDRNATHWTQEHGSVQNEATHNVSSEHVATPPALPAEENASDNATPSVPNVDSESPVVPLASLPDTAPQPARNDTQEDIQNRTTEKEPAPQVRESGQADPARQTRDSANETVNASAQGNATDDNSTAELEALYGTAQTALAMGDTKASRAAVAAMIDHPKAPEPLREELLYTLADIIMQDGKADMEGNFTAILDAYEAAKNSNLNSPNVPEALSSIGYLHLSVGNVPEAKGYFDLLRRKHPNDPRVAMIDYYWGEHYLRRNQYARAAEHFQYAIQNFPMSKAVQPSTVGLLKAFTELGFFDKALEIVNTIEKRWPRYYLTDPSFLMAAGYASMLSGNLDRAKEYFWAYANLVPQAPDADVAMARIGDILLQQGKPDAAREIYHRTAKAYPDREGGLIAQMRLAEEGVLDRPSMADMDLVFGRPEANPGILYNRILEHADSSLAPVARLKLAMWQLWNKKFAESLEEVLRFQEDYPGHELLPKAREVADKALRDWIMHDLEKNDFAGAALHWTEHEKLYQDRDLEPQIRLVVATAFMKTKQPQKALDMAGPFVFGTIPRGEYSEPGLDLTLAMLVDLQDWKGILDLAQRVAPWKVGQERQRQIDYAAALAHEKLNQSSKAKPLWTKLATDMGLTDTQRGYAHYFLGREAMLAGDMEQATILGQEALGLLQKEKDDIGKLKETLELLVQAADRSGRGQEALAWSLQYDDFISQDDQDWPAHTYRKAILFKKNGDMKKWRENLDRLKELFPNSLHGRMAAAELEGVRLEKEVGKFR